MPYNVFINFRQCYAHRRLGRNTARITAIPNKQRSRWFYS